HEGCRGNNLVIPRVVDDCPYPQSSAKNQSNRFLIQALREYVPTARRPAFTRFNVFLRDNFSCQYCNDHLPTHELTFDHVIPRSKGGKTSWDNVITACGSCNLLKADHLPQEIRMFPRRRPAQPTTWELQENGRAFPPNYLHESWRDYLYWDVELET
ncbi:hypothetical protein GOB90_10310, partial [Acetobacter oeni]|nr:hypothetical protein [Acetobacter oeni]